jgi:hypothetical protein
LLEDPLNVGIAAEKQARVLFLEDFQPTVRADRFAEVGRIWRRGRRAADRGGEALGGLRAIRCGAQVNPCPRREARRQGGHGKRIGRPGQQHRDQALGVAEVRAVQRQPERTRLARASPRGADEHGAHGRAALLGSRPV